MTPETDMTTEDRLARTEERLQRIEGELARCVMLLEHMTEKMDERTAASDQWRSKVEKTVYGDGNGSPGHHIKLDRLLQAQERQKWVIRTLGAAVIGLALKAAWAALGA